MVRRSQYSEWAKIGIQREWCLIPGMGTISAVLQDMQSDSKALPAPYPMGAREYWENVCRIGTRLRAARLKNCRSTISRDKEFINFLKRPHSAMGPIKHRIKK
jgi:hypothetical protein